MKLSPEMQRAIDAAGLSAAEERNQISLANDRLRRELIECEAYFIARNLGVTAAIRLRCIQATLKATGTEAAC